ncbi:hypothetical protein A2U01_0088997, partial [Trifolium medium]|nr:hypothetical protein [Trifolium medium]
MEWRWRAAADGDGGGRGWCAAVLDDDDLQREMKMR